MYKGSLKLIVLKELSRKSMNGYMLMSSIAEISGKRPSSGSIYPLLSEMRKKGLVSVKSEKRSKVYSLTKEGRAEFKRFSEHIEDVHKRMGSMIKIFSSISDDAVMRLLKSSLDMLKTDPKRAMTFNKEMFQLKSEMLRVLKDYDKQNVAEARKIIVDATSRLKRLR